MSSNVPTKSGRRSRGGRGRGRGRVQVDSENEVLETIRQANRATNRHIAGLSTAQKAELLSRKREKELQRIVLPDAPPRKKRTRQPSPERHPCEMVVESPVPSTSQQSPWKEEPSTPQSVVVTDEDADSSHTNLLNEIVLEVGNDVVIASRSNIDSLNETLLEVGNGIVIASPSNIDLLNETVLEVGNDVVIASRSNIDVNHPRFKESMEQCFQIESDVDSDDDDDQVEPEPLDVNCLRTVEELTPEQQHILQAEDTANDIVLQEVLSSDAFTFEWSKERSTFKGKREIFTGTPGPTFDLSDLQPTDIFEKMFDTSFIDMLVTETNKYAAHKLLSIEDMSVKSRLRQWKDTDRTEMISFLSLIIIQGLYPLQNEESYFSFNGFGTMPYISRIMSYNRYILLKSMLHFSDNTIQQADSTSKLKKIQPIIDYFNKQFSALYQPNQEIAIDESLMKWFGRLGIIQKINTKAAKVGVKTYELCESKTGYLWRFLVYAGKGTQYNNQDDQTDTNENNENTRQTDDRPDYRPCNATAKIVLNLIEPLLHRGHTVIMDNFYNSPLLARYLKQNGTDCFGTQRLHREFIPSSMKSITKSDLRQGEVVATYCADLSLMAWADVKLVSMISTYHPLQVGIQEKNNIMRYKPSIVLDYNKNMGGIDRKDQYLSAHPLERSRNRVWYKKLFRRLFNCAIFNCFVIYNSKTKINQRQFRTVLAEGLLKIYRKIDLTTEARVITRTYKDKVVSVRNHVGSKLTLRNRPNVEGNHFPVPNGTKKGRCWFCKQLRKDSRTVWKCKECGINLCILDCFIDFHKP